MDISEKLGLPVVVNTPLNSEIDFYGLSSVIAKQLQLDKVPESFATWRHGWIFSPLRYVAQIIWTYNDAPYHLVATRKEASFLSDKGIDNVVAVGLPFIYADLHDIERLPNSLLVMPPHTLEYVKYGMDELSYIEYIRSISKSFSKVVFCLHQACIAQGNWCRSLEMAGIDWVVGASAHDANSLTRLQKLFRSFEYMTTCTIGSHIIYGAYCGCKVSISGIFFEYTKEAFENDSYYRQYPEILNYNLEHSCEAAVKSRFPFLFVEPACAIQLIDWAYEEAGVSNRKDTKELKKFLGWDLRGQINQRFPMLKRTTLKFIDISERLLRLVATRDHR